MTKTIYEKLCVLFSLAYVPSANMEEAGYMTYPAARPRASLWGNQSCRPSLYTVSALWFVMKKNSTI